MPLVNSYQLCELTPIPWELEVRSVYCMYLYLNCKFKWLVISLACVCFSTWRIKECNIEKKKKKENRIENVSKEVETTKKNRFHLASHQMKTTLAKCQHSVNGVILDSWGLTPWLCAMGVLPQTYTPRSKFLRSIKTHK